MLWKYLLQFNFNFKDFMLPKFEKLIGLPKTKQKIKVLIKYVY